ncbi:unnamed protein product [Sphagnum jensenii]|uniref:Uncharacterized protein n=1 Tax=Sphagnum jensenii TaxID=128206 RepID=A0ABP0VER0_9BRYO
MERKRPSTAATAKDLICESKTPPIGSRKATRSAEEATVSAKAIWLSARRPLQPTERFFTRVCESIAAADIYQPGDQSRWRQRQDHQARAAGGSPLHQRLGEELLLISCSSVTSAPFAAAALLLAGGRQGERHHSGECAALSAHSLREQCGRLACRAALPRAGLRGPRQQQQAGRALVVGPAAQLRPDALQTGRARAR